jgi:DNA-binding beta-propeller fold protein YncE
MSSIVAWNDQLYVSDLYNYRILAFPFSTTEGSPDGITIIGRYGSGPALNQINDVYSMVLDRIHGLFYLSDFQNCRILKLNLTDNTLQLVVGTGMTGSDNVSLNLPLGITVNETTDSLYVTDSRNHRVQKFDFNSIEGITVAGGITYGQNLSQLYLPSGIAIDSASNVYVADSGNHRIVQWLVGAQQGRIIAGIINKKKQLFYKKLTKSFCLISFIHKKFFDFYSRYWHSWHK